MEEDEEEDEEDAAHISSIGTRRPRRRPRTSPSASSCCRRRLVSDPFARLAVRRTAARHRIARASCDVIAGEKTSTTTSRSSAVTSRRATDEGVSARGDYVVVTSVSSEKFRVQFVVTERSLHGNRAVFAKNSLSASDFQIYDAVWQRAVSELGQIDTCFLHLKAPATHCETRVTARQRKGEGAVDLAYLHSINLAYDAWLQGERNVVEIDATQNEMNVFDDALKQVASWSTPLICSQVPAGNYRSDGELSAKHPKHSASGATTTGV